MPPLRSELAPARRVAWAGLWINLVLAVLKIVAGILGRSQAVVADGIHSVSDLATDLTVIFGMKMWTAPADDDHPHGHRRIETLVTLAIGVSLFAVAGGIGWDAIQHLLEPARQPPTALALVAGLVSIATKEWLYRWTAAVGQRVSSSALEANAWHHRTDALSSVPAVLSVAAAMLRPEWVVVDRIGALVVCVFILWAAWRIVAPAVAQLSDQGAPPEERELLERLALQVQGVESAHALRTRYVGPRLAVDVHVEVDPELSVREGFLIAHEVKKRLLTEGPGVADVVVQLEPCGGVRGTDGSPATG